MSQTRRMVDMKTSNTLSPDSYQPSYDHKIRVQPSDRMAVQVSDVTLSYGKGNKSKVILNKINLNVTEAVIYGLLGPSGCGKTTLLRCIIGRIQADQGYISIFGLQPNHPDSQIPGPGIGYMPQEMAVYDDLTIEETLQYFGRLYRLKQTFLNQRIEFLLTFLHLLDKNQMVGDLSGGQKRRVSLAMALVHSPPLLILDEPTVGVDPLLRHSIWHHLVSLTQTSRTTVIITTHYIEEARMANVVGLMRGGRLLAEDSPEQLMSQYNALSLENVFLKLCTTDLSLKASALAKRTGIIPDSCDKHLKNDGKIYTLTPNPTPNPSPTSSPRPVRSLSLKPNTHSLELYIRSKTLQTKSQKAKYESNTKRFREYMSTTMAMTWKNYIRLSRNIPLLLFQFFVPSLQVCLFCLCIGGQPFNINVAIVNNEDPPFLSRMFLDRIDTHLVKQHKFSNFNEAIEAVKKGEMWGVLHIPDQFSLNLQRRMVFGKDVDYDVIAGSTIRIYPDLTNKHIWHSMERTINKAFESLQKEMLKILGQNPALIEPPIALGNTVYNLTEKQGNLEFMAPGVVINICYVLATGLTALSFVMERRNGLLERSLIAGIDTTQILISHSMIQIFVMIIQTVLVLLFIFLVFDIPSRGPVIWVVLLLLLQGCTGMAYGLVVSALCHQEQSAIGMILGTFYPNFIISGLFWPMEAMPHWIQGIGYIQPQTIPGQAFRNIISRGWTLDNSGVWMGFLITIFYLIFYFILSAIIFKFRK